MSKTAKIIALLAIIFWILVGWYIISILQFFPSFISLNRQVDYWYKECHKNFVGTVSMELAKTNIDAETWRVIYKFPMRPYARCRVHFEGDGSVSREELEKLALQAARKTDEMFVGRKTKVEVDVFENDDGSYTYRVVFLKRCVSLYRIWRRYEGE